MENINLRILDYFDVLDEIKRITNNNLFEKHDGARTDLDNIEIPYYTLGKGSNHIVIVGATHGSEIITTDFVLRLMEEISLKQGVFSDIDLENNYTLHFLPLFNPEGYIISTSAIRTLIKKDFSEERIEEICKKYFLCYREDDIFSKNNPRNFSLKLHQKMFKHVTYEVIPEKFANLRESVKKIYSDSRVPLGSLIIHRGNGHGEETNRILKNEKNDFSFGHRYNNINLNIPGPLGVCPKSPLIQNVFLEELIDKLYKEKKFIGMLNFHSTGGMIFSRGTKFDYINEILMKEYQLYTMCETSFGKMKGYKIMDSLGNSYFDEYLRFKYPACLLIELSYMGGNPLGPYGDKVNNYIPTIENNLIAVKHFLKKCLENKDLMYKK